METRSNHNAPNQRSPSRILFAMTPEWGSYLPALPLAAQLKRRGFEVSFLGPPQGWQDEATDNLITFLGGRGVGCLRAAPVPFPKTPRDYLQAGKLIDRALADLGALLIDNRVSLVVGDSISPLASAVPMVAARRGIPFACLETNLLSSMNRRLPPFTSTLVPGSSGRFRPGTVLAAWLARAAWIGLRSVLRSDARLFAIAQAMLATRSRGLGLDGRFFSSFTEYGWRMRPQPRFVLCPEAFEFPGAPKRTYLGGCIDEARDSEGNGAAAVAGGPLFYCSLGTHSNQYPTSKRFFQTLIEAFRRRPQYRAVVHVGDAVAPDDLRPIPDGVRVEKWVAQPDVLRVADAAITHGGLGTIKECVRFLVPMLVFPMSYDQPGNSARVVWHGLGQRGDSRTITAAALATELDRVLQRRDHHRDRLAALRPSFTATEPLIAGAEMLASMAAPGPQSNQSLPQ